MSWGRFMTNIDPEISAMSTIAETLSHLDDPVKIRVLNWAFEKFSLKKSGDLNKEKIVERINSNVDSTVKTGNISINNFDNLAEFFAHLNLNTEHEKALAVAAFLQSKDDKSEVTSLEINGELKNLGHASSNITRAIATLMNQKPQPIVQTKKEGKSKQAQKKFRVTVHGFTTISQWLNNNFVDSEGQ